MSEKDGSSKVKGALFTLASGAVTAFCWAQYMRAGKDERKIKELFQYRTTIKDLEMMLAKGKTLPKIAIICGQLDADEPMGSNGDIAIQQHLLTRLAPSIALGRNSRLTRGATEGDRPIRRTPKDVRYTVATARLDAEGLHLRGTQGGEADIHLPEMITEMGHNSPCLFLSQADALQEFMSTDDWKEQLTAKEKDDLSKTPLAETGKRFTHLSKFVSDDKEPKGDIPMQFLRDCHSKLAYLEHHDEKQGYFSVFQQDKTSWFWNPVGFYDYSAQETNIPTWWSYPRCEFVNFSEFLRRAETAAAENVQNSAYAPAGVDLSAIRDSEFGFRFVELTIPVKQNVTVVARPVAKTEEGGKRAIELHEPLKDTFDGNNFRFRILKGHSVDRLLEHRAVRRQHWQRVVYFSSSITAMAAAYTSFFC